MERVLRSFVERRLFWGCLVFGLVVDLGSKAWAQAKFQPDGWSPGIATEVHPIIEGVIAWKWAGNIGAAFSMLAGKVTLLAVLGVVILAGLIWYVYQSDPRERLLAGTLGFIAAGAVGNVSDRIRFGYVRDMLYFDFDLPFHEAVSFIPRRYPVFNVADIWIVVGAILLVIVVQKQENARKRAEAEAAAST